VVPSLINTHSWLKMMRILTLSANRLFPPSHSVTKCFVWLKKRDKICLFSVIWSSKSYMRPYTPLPSTISSTTMTLKVQKKRTCKLYALISLKSSSRMPLCSDGLKSNWKQSRTECRIWLTKCSEIIDPAKKRELGKSCKLKSWRIKWRGDRNVKLRSEKNLRLKARTAILISSSSNSYRLILN